MPRSTNEEMLFAGLAIGEVAVTDGEIERLYDRLQRIRERTGCQYRVSEAVTGQVVVRRVR